MDMRKEEAKDHIVILRDIIRKHGGKYTWYHYTTKFGQVPIATETMWHNDIHDGSDLLNVVAAKS